MAEKKTETKPAKKPEKKDMISVEEMMKQLRKQKKPAFVDTPYDYFKDQK